MHASLKLAETVLWAPSLPPRSGGEGGAAPAGGAPGGGWCNCAQTPPTPDPSPPLASARGGRGAEKPVVSLSRCLHGRMRGRGEEMSRTDGKPNNTSACAPSCHFTTIRPSTPVRSVP